MVYLSSALLLLVAVDLTTANPEAFKRFHAVVDGDSCLKECMEQVRSTGLELSALHSVNLTAHFLQLDRVCAAVEGARACVAACGVEGNPFALRHMTVLCEPHATDVRADLTPCLAHNGAAISQECRQECGNYDAIAESIFHLTKQLAELREDTSGDAEDKSAQGSLTNAGSKSGHFFGPLPTQPELGAALERATDAGCASFKCHMRCQVLRSARRCRPLPDGNNAGGALRHLVELVLHAHRADLAQARVLDRMIEQSPPQCTHLFAPEVVFDHRRDQLLMLAAKLRRAAADALKTTAGDVAN